MFYVVREVLNTVKMWANSPPLERRSRWNCNQTVTMFDLTLLVV